MSGHPAQSARTSNIRGLPETAVERASPVLPPEPTRVHDRAATRLRRARDARERRRHYRACHECSEGGS